jgi:hypothetical protein
MMTAILVLLLVALGVTLSIIRPGGGHLVEPAPVDRDRERLLADLRALPGFRSDFRLP